MNPIFFWEKKILTWERDRYGDHGSSSLLESVAKRASSSLLRRLECAKEILEPRVSGKRVLELGCGSGRLAESLILAGARSYTGIDIAKSAVDAGLINAKERGLSGVVNFKVGEVRTAVGNDVDIVFSLGLLDWLADDEIELYFFKIQRRRLPSLNFRKKAFGRANPAPAVLFRRLWVQNEGVCPALSVR